MPVAAPLRSHFHALPSAPGDEETPSHPHQRDAEDRRWIVLDGGNTKPSSETLSAPLQQTEAELNGMRMRALLQENQKLREALRMDHKMPMDGLRVQHNAGSGMRDRLRDLGDASEQQRDEMSRLRSEHEQVMLQHLPPTHPLSPPHSCTLADGVWQHRLHSDKRL